MVLLVVCCATSAQQVTSFIFPVKEVNGNRFASNEDQLRQIGYKIEPGQSFNDLTSDGYHDGIDLNRISGNDCGDPVVAIADGVVVASVPGNTGFGNFVRLRHQTPEGTIYSQVAHLSERLVIVGDSVTQGQVVGRIGTTGYSTGCHIHFSILRSNSTGAGYYPNPVSTSTHINPLELLRQYAPYQYPSRGAFYQGPVTGGQHTNWEYTAGNVVTNIAEGSSPVALLKITNIRRDHRFKARFFQNDVFKYEWQTDWTRVGGWWDKAFFWAPIENAPPGQWRVDVQIDVGYGYFLLDQFTVTVNPSWVSDYTYDNNGYVCTGPITHLGNWNYGGTVRRTQFNAGDSVYAVIKITNVLKSHRFRVRMYLGSTQQWSWETGWNIVAPGTTWDKAYFWPGAWNVTAGNWEFRIDVDTGGGYSELDRLPFSVASGSPRYRFDSNGVACRSVDPGTAANDWVFTPQNVRDRFTVGQNVHTVVRFNDLKRSHRFKVVAYRDSVRQWEWVTGWNDVQEGYPWKWAYFTPILYNAPRGAWEFKIYIDVGDPSFEYKKSIFFRVE